MCSGEEPNRSGKHLVSDAVFEKASIRASDSTPAERYTKFSELLKEWGFRDTQLVLINDAMKELGLEFTDANARK